MPWSRLSGFGLVLAAVLVAVVVSYQRADKADGPAVQRLLDASAAQVAGIVDRRLAEARLRLALQANSTRDTTMARLPLDGTDPRVPIGALMTAAGSGPEPGRPGLTPPYRLEGQWHAALVGNPDPRGTEVAILSLSGLRGAIDAFAEQAAIEIVIVSAADRVWWSSPLDEGALDLPVTQTRFGASDATAGGDRLAQWAGDSPVSTSDLPDFGLTVHVRAHEGFAGAIGDEDRFGAILIILTGLAGLAGCALALRGAGPRRTAQVLAAPPVAARPPARAAAAPPADYGAETADFPFLVYQIRPDEAGHPAAELMARGQPTLFGIEENRSRLPLEGLLERVADQQRRDLANYLSGRNDAEPPPWLDWDTGTERSIVLLHVPCRGGARGPRSKDRTGLLVPADQLHAAWVRLEESAREANAANTRKSRFLARLSHELRTPLNAIIGFAELMENETLGPVGTPRYKDYLADIGASGRHLHDLINDIIDISRVETGELDLSESILPVKSELQACVRFVRERLAAAELEFVFDVPDDLPKLRADPLRFRQILLNLLSNAIKFTKPGGTVGLEAAIMSDGSLRISVADTGIGMDEAGVARAMEPFGRISDDSYGPTEGTGLGLPIARGLTALHGGRFEIESAPGAGTTVSVIFPTARLIPAE